MANKNRKWWVRVINRARWIKRKRNKATHQCEKCGSYRTRVEKGLGDGSIEFTLNAHYSCYCLDCNHLRTVNVSVYPDEIDAEYRDGHECEFCPEEESSPAA
jgi:hypothetical protein